jgi:glyoxylase-like metal-dependent hydrolase (beta-lactamase superfamily II)
LGKEMIITKTGKIDDYLHHIDLKEFGRSNILTSFIAEFDDNILFLDCGGSLEVKHLLRYVNKNKLDLSKVKYLITTHHHFDHCGGMWKLYNKIKKHNPEVKILTNEKTKRLLNDFEFHLNRAKRTFGKFIGKMKPIEEQAFKLIQPDENFEHGINSISILDSFKVQNSKIELAILKTPGHTPDHQCPLFIKNGNIDFIFYGEAVGTIYHSQKLITMPTSMPVFFNYNDYMTTVKKLKTIIPQKAGFGHFGVIKGKNNVRETLLEHEIFMDEFRKKVIEFYSEKPETSYVFNKILPFFKNRTDMIGNSHPIMKNLILAVVYGMMMDLGYRKV